MLDQPEDLANTKRDISISLKEKLRKVAENQDSPFGNNWPDDVTMQKLLKKAGHVLRRYTAFFWNLVIRMAKSFRCLTVLLSLTCPR